MKKIAYSNTTSKVAVTARYYQTTQISLNNRFAIADPEQCQNRLQGIFGSGFVLLFGRLMPQYQTSHRIPGSRAAVVFEMELSRIRSAFFIFWMIAWFVLAPDGFSQTVIHSVPNAVSPPSVSIATNPVVQVSVTDSTSTSSDLSNSTDTDDPNARELTIRWTTIDTSLRDIHLYVEVDGEKRTYLGRTGNGTSSEFT